MPDSEHALLKQAFQHAENCLAEANAIVGGGATTESARRGTEAARSIFLTIK